MKKSLLLTLLYVSYIPASEKIHHRVIRDLQKGTYILKFIRGLDENRKIETIKLDGMAAFLKIRQTKA